jgi:hypothetical protein
MLDFDISHKKVYVILILIGLGRCFYCPSATCRLGVHKIDDGLVSLTKTVTLHMFLLSTHPLYLNRPPQFVAQFLLRRHFGMRSGPHLTQRVKIVVLRLFTANWV